MQSGLIIVLGTRYVISLINIIERLIFICRKYLVAVSDIGTKLKKKNKNEYL